jgi:hypothetical protein
MKRITTSIVLGCANLIGVGLEYLADSKHKQLPYSILLTFSVAFPFILFATIGFAIRDLIRPDTRWQAIIALALSIPIGIIYYHHP